MLLIILLLVSVILIIVSTSRYRFHPFLALLFVALFFGLLSGMPLESIVQSINEGFGKTIGQIGIVIIAGVIIGTFLEQSGGAYAMANRVLKFTGKKQVPLTMSIIGYFVSIPVFADSGFVILLPLTKALSKEAKISLAGSACALALGLAAGLLGALLALPFSRATVLPVGAILGILTFAGYGLYAVVDAAWVASSIGAVIGGGLGVPMGLWASWQMAHDDRRAGRPRARRPDADADSWQPDFGDAEADDDA